MPGTGVSGHVGDGLEDSCLVVVPTGDEVGLELGRELEVCVADAIHSLHPASVFEIHLREAHDRRPTEEIDDGQQHECEGDEAGSEVGRLGGECECNHGARERSHEDRRPAHCLRVSEATRVASRLQCSVVRIWSVCGPAVTCGVAGSVGTAREAGSGSNTVATSRGALKNLHEVRTRGPLLWNRKGVYLSDGAVTVVSGVGSRDESRVAPQARSRLGPAILSTQLGSRNTGTRRAQGGPHAPHSCSVRQAATFRSLMTEESVHRVVVVGGGFGGLQAALKLRRTSVEVTLVDRRNFHLFQPLTYQVATGALSPGEIAYPLRAIFKRHRNVRVLMAEVFDFDLEARELHLRPVAGIPRTSSNPLRHPDRRRRRALLILGHDDWSEYAAEVKSLESALVVRSRLLSAFEAAEMEPDLKLRARWLTFVVVGAGPTGAEMAGQIAELARDTLRRDFRTIDPRTARILLVEAADRVLTGFPPSLGEGRTIAAKARRDRAHEPLGDRRRRRRRDGRRRQRLDGAHPQPHSRLGRGCHRLLASPRGWAS